MRSVFVFLLSAATFCFFSFDVSAYSFSVQVQNNTGHDLKSVTVRWKGKGNPRPGSCFYERTITAGGSYEIGCSNTSVEKWQRQINVSFACPGHGLRTISFPRKTKFYKRDHASNNSDRYRVKLKASDC